MSPGILKKIDGLCEQDEIVNNVIIKKRLHSAVLCLISIFVFFCFFLFQCHNKDKVTVNVEHGR